MYLCNHNKTKEINIWSQFMLMYIFISVPLKWDELNN